MYNAFAGWIIMAGILTCFAVAVWLAVVERREDKQADRAAAQEKEFQSKRIEAARKHQEEQMRLMGEDWRDAV